MLVHPFDPVWAPDSQVLILGTFPSVQSREDGFYYGHRQNRFWRVLASLYGQGVPVSIPEKTQLLISNRIALWDVLYSCEITGSADASIRHAVPNDIPRLLKASCIRRIYTNGVKAHALYTRFIFEGTRLNDICLPSTSPANAVFSLERLLEAWRVIRNDPED